MSMDQGIEPIQPPAVGPEPAGLQRSAALALGEKPPKEAKVDPYADDTALLKFANQALKECWDNRLTYERVWWRNLLYLLDRQWIRYNRGTGTWVDKRLARWVPKPVTNLLRENQAAIQSVFSAVQLGVICRPNGNAPLDVTTAETATDIYPAIWAEHEMDAKQAIADFWLIATGNVILHPWWDKRHEQGIITVPMEMCVRCQQPIDPAAIHAAGGRCPSCGGAGITMAMGPDEEPITQQIAFGRGCTDVLSPFEFGVPGYYTNLDDAHLCVRKRWRPRSWYERFHADLIKTAKIQWETAPADRSLQMLRGLAVQNDLPGTMFGSTMGDTGDLEGTTEYEIWAKPCKTYEGGLMLRVVGEGGAAQVVRIEEEGLPGPLPYQTPDGKIVFPWVHGRYEDFGGRFWGRSPHDSQIMKQDLLNQLDSLTILILTRTANPIWLEPKGAEVQKFTGEPGLVVKYNATLAGNGAKPERIPGENVPPSIANVRNAILNDVERGYGTYDVIKGAKPAGVEAFAALQLLVERSQSRFGPVLSSRGLVNQRWYAISLELERQYGPVDRVWATMGPNGGWAFQQFKNADLQGGIRIVMEDGSQSPKTSLGMRAAVQQLKTIGVINPMDPDTGYRILQVFGQTSLAPRLDANVKSALQEQDAFERWAQGAEVQPSLSLDPMTGQPTQTTGWSTPPPGRRLPWHNDLIHLAEHLKWANGDSVRRLLERRPEVESAVAWMIQQHEMAMQPAAPIAGATGPGGAPGLPPAGADGGGEGAGRMLTQSNAEAGNPADVPSGQSEAVQGRGPE